MKRIISILIAVTLLGTMLAGCGKSESKTTTEAGTETKTKTDTETDGEVYEFTIANSVAKGVYHSEIQHYLTEKLEERSNGRIKCTVYDSNSYGANTPEQVTMVSEGSLTATSAHPGAISMQSDALKPFNVYDYPYLVDSHEELYALMDGEVGQELNKLLEEHLNVKCFGSFTQGMCVLSSNKPIHTVEDIKGQKIRGGAVSLTVGTIEMWGGTSASIEYTEVYSAMQQGACDGIAASISLWPSTKWYEVQDYLCVNNFSDMPHILMVNLDWYNSLPEDLRTIFDEVMEEELGTIRKMAEDAVDESPDFLADYMEIYYPTEGEMEAWKAPARDMWKKYADVAGMETLNKALEFLGKEPI